MMVPSSKGRGEVLHVELEMSEEIDILACFKGIKGIDSAIDRRINENLASRSSKGSLFNRGDYFSNIKAADLFHLERSSIQISILPSELVRIRIIFEILFSIYITTVVL